METQIEEKIRVVSLFEEGQVKPLVFFWQNRNYKILRTVFTYSKNIGREKVFYFSVQCQKGDFEISFSLENFSWKLERIYAV